MIKRLLLLLAALMPLCACASGEEANLPMSAAECPIRIEDFVPKHVAQVPTPDVRFSPEDMPVITDMEADGSTVWFTLSGVCERAELTAELSMIHAGERLKADNATLLETDDGRVRLRFGLPDEASAVYLMDCTLRAAYREEGYDEVVSVRYGNLRQPAARETRLNLSTADGNFVYRYEKKSVMIPLDPSPEEAGFSSVYGYGRGDVLNAYSVDGSDGFLAHYNDDGNLSQVSVHTENPAREYTFDGSGALLSMEDKGAGICIDYDSQSGVMTQYEARFTVPGTADTARMAYSPYGTVLDLTYYPASPKEDVECYAWKPYYGWHYWKTRDTQTYPLSDADADALGLSALLETEPPLPAAQMPEFRLDVSAAADLPRIPLKGKNLPRVLDFRVRDGLATVVLERPPALEGGGLRVCDLGWMWSDIHGEAFAATASEYGLIYTAAVPESMSRDDLCVNICFPAADASHFSCQYYCDPDTGLWEAHLNSPAAWFEYRFASDGSMEDAVFGSWLNPLIHRCSLTFDRATGDMTRYSYYVEAPWDDNGWYELLYVPGDGITSAYVGIGEAAFYCWEPETGWLDTDGGLADVELLDPLDFPYPLPFPAEP